MNTIINGQPHILPKQSTIHAVLELFCGSPIPSGVAVALNEEVIPNSHWMDTFVEDGDSIEILWASSGG